MADNVETMAYTGETPWHGIGQHVDPNMTPEEMVKAAGLDWKVKKRPLMAMDADGILGKPKIPLVDHFALVRDSDQYVLGICGKEYVPFQNEDVFKFYDKFTRAGQMTMETAGSLNHGRNIWALARLKEGFQLVGGDEVRGYLLMNQPHIWGQAAVFMFTPIRVVCWNTLQMALADKVSDKFRAPHIQDFGPEVIRQAEIALGLAEDNLINFKERAEFLSRKRVERNALMEYYFRIFQKELVPEDQISHLKGDKSFKVDYGPVKRLSVQALESFEKAPGSEMESAKGTWWGALNSITFMVDHVIGRDRDTALTSAWFGPRARVKRAALELATDYAKAA